LLTGKRDAAAKISPAIPGSAEDGRTARPDVKRRNIRLQTSLSQGERAPPGDHRDGFCLLCCTLRYLTISWKQRLLLRSSGLKWQDSLTIGHNCAARRDFSHALDVIFVTPACAIRWKPRFALPQRPHSVCGKVFVACVSNHLLSRAVSCDPERRAKQRWWDFDNKRDGIVRNKRRR
jgi:hypothetical protein